MISMTRATTRCTPNCRRNYFSLGPKNGMWTATTIPVVTRRRSRRDSKGLGISFYNIFPFRFSDSDGKRGKKAPIISFEMKQMYCLI